MKKDLLILAGVVAVTYAWLWYSMNTIHNPLLSMLVYYPVFCFGGSYLLRKISFGVKHDEIPEKTSAHKPLHLTILYSLVATAVIWAGYLLIRPGLVDPEKVTRGLEVCGMYKETYWLTGWLVVLINPGFEEYLWRFGVFTFLDRRYPHQVACNVSSLIFAGYHPIVAAQFFPVFWLIPIFALVYWAGLAFAHLFHMTRNIYYVSVFHAVINVNLMLMGYIFAPHAPS